MSTEHPTPDPGGFVPRLGADPSSARYELLTAAQAVERVAAVGFDPTDAARMVEQYLAQNIAAFGPGPGDGWRVDPYDLAEITRAYDWVDHHRGETIADARARAAGYATDYQQRAAAVDRERDPGYAARMDREATEWADRARDGHNPWPAPNPRMPTADGVIGDRTVEEERAAVEAVSDALEDDEPRTAAQDETAGSDVVGLVCPECEEDVIDRPPTALVPYRAHEMQRPGYSHLDGEPLCPVLGPHGYQPAEPVEIHAPAAVDETPHGHDGGTGDGHKDSDGDGQQDGDGGVRGPDDGPRPVPLGGPAATPRDTDTDADTVPGATAARVGDQAGERRDEAGAGRDDPDAVAWWEPIGTGEVTLSHPEVVAELTHAGMTADQARDALTRYLDDTSREVGVSVHRWGLDLHDVQAIAHTHHAGQVAAVPEQRDPARGEWDQVRGEDPRSYDQMMGDAAAALTARPAVPVGVEDQRREQLIRWHTDDRAHTDGHEHGYGHGGDGAVRALDDYAPTGTSEQW